MGNWSPYSEEWEQQRVQKALGQIAEDYTHKKAAFERLPRPIQALIKAGQTILDDADQEAVVIIRLALKEVCIALNCECAVGDALLALAAFGVDDVRIRAVDDSGVCGIVFPENFIDQGIRRSGQSTTIVRNALSYGVGIVNDFFFGMVHHPSPRRFSCIPSPLLCGIRERKASGRKGLPGCLTVE